MAEFISFQPSDYFAKILTLTGTGATRSVTYSGPTGDVQPDMVWSKCRDTTYDHSLMDTVRGATKHIKPNTDGIEGTTAGGLTAFNSDGFTMGSDGDWNQSAKTYVYWSWKAGTTSGITGGTITPSSYSINTTSGCGIYAYAGTGSTGTIAHGLGVAPKCMFIKCLNAASTDWVTWISPMAVNEYMYLNSNASATSDTDFMNSVLPSSTLISLGTKANVNGSGKTFIAYVFRDIPGYSKMGEYWGNGQSADGTFVYTGFRPAFIITKKLAGSVDWWMFDNKRIGYNPKQYRLLADTDAIETSTGYVDLLSNGFKWRSSDGDINGSGDTFAYAAFAEFPLVSSNDVPGVAR